MGSGFKIPVIGWIIAAIVILGGFFMSSNNNKIVNKDNQEAKSEMQEVSRRMSNSMDKEFGRKAETQNQQEKQVATATQKDEREPLLGNDFDKKFENFDERFKKF